MAEELKDANTASFFYFQINSTQGHPSVAQLKECFTVLLAEASGGPEVYADYTTTGFTCRNMKQAHSALKISASAFDKFVVVAAGVLKTAGVTNADIATIGAVLNGTKSDVVDAVNGADKFTPPN